MKEYIDIKFGTLSPIRVNHPTEGMVEFNCFGKFSYKGVAGVPEELVRSYVVNTITSFVATNIVKYSITSFTSILVNSVPNIILAINTNISEMGAELTNLNIESFNKCRKK